MMMRGGKINKKEYNEGGGGCWGRYLYGLGFHLGEGRGEETVLERNFTALFFARFFPKRREGMDRCGGTSQINQICVVHRDIIISLLMITTHYISKIT